MRGKVSNVWKPMKKLLTVLSLLVLCLVVGGVANANLVVNGTFQEVTYGWDMTELLIPSWKGWGISIASQGSNYGFWDVAGYGGPTKYGVYFAGPGPDYDAIGQTILTDPGELYTFRFCLARINTSSIYPDVSAVFHAYWNGTSVLEINSADTFDWTYYTFTVLATDLSSTIGFAGSALSSGGGYEFTDISVVPGAVPVPGTAVLLGSALLSLLGWRRLRKR